MPKITIERHRNKLRLRWNFEGKVRTLSCGVDASPVGYAYANQLKARMELDIQSGYFDKTLLKYKPKIIGKTATELTACELFRRYTAHRAKTENLSPGTLRCYHHIQGHLDKRLNIPAHQVSDRLAGDFASYLSERLSGHTAKAHLYRLAACWQWSQGKYQTQELNPWEPLAARVKPSPRQRVKPFSMPELVAILEAFRTHRHYRHYFAYVLFLANTGCRMGEASALKWQYIGSDFKTAWIGESVSRGHRKSTKTNKARTIVLNPVVSQLLSDRHHVTKPSPDDLVFPSPKGLPINDKLFRQRAWKTILEQCHIEYRKPYALRHTAGSMAAENGVNPVAIAEQLGHDKRVFLSTYAHALQKNSVFQSVGVGDG